MRTLTPYALASVLALAAFPSMAQTASITVSVAPPPLRVETIPPRPAVGWLWAPGHWVRSANTWAWTTGAWVRPHTTHRHYVGARWVRRGDVWVFRRGGYTDRVGGPVRVTHRHPAPRSLAGQAARLNKKADRLDAKADRAAARGNVRKAKKLDAKADRLENAADKKKRKAAKRRRQR